MRSLRTLRVPLFVVTLSGALLAGSTEVGSATPAPEARAVVQGQLAPSPSAPPLRPNTAPPGAPRAIGRCDASAPAHSFTIAHVNDMQARYTSRLAGKSRWAYVAGYLRQLKDEVPETLVMDAGDDYEKGSIAELRSMGESTRQMLQAMSIDVRTIGNHDFAYGEAQVLRDLLSSAHPVLAANVGYADGTSPFLPYASFVVGCVKVGVVGLVTQSYGADDLPSKAPYAGVLVHDARYEAAAERVVRAHRAEVDVMIALDHLGLFEDVRVAQRVAGLDLIVGGHSEDLVRAPLPVLRADGSRAWVVQAGHYAEAIGRLDLSYWPQPKRLVVDRARIVEVTAALPVAADVADLAARLEREYAPEALAPIAFAKTAIGVAAMPELVFRAAREAWGVDAMLVGRDLFWDGVPAGPITLQRLYDAVLVQREPAGTSGFSSLFVVEVTGAELADLGAKAGGGGRFALFLPPPLGAAQATRTYRFAIEKRALTVPSLAFRGAPKLPEARYAGEMIDVLESFARGRSRLGLALD
jgi:5'-nucleotidase / UDP-sugar diphosphatase